jgi:hypothetical protein
VVIAIIFVFDLAISEHYLKFIPIDKFLLTECHNSQGLPETSHRKHIDFTVGNYCGCIFVSQDDDSLPVS